MEPTMRFHSLAARVFSQQWAGDQRTGSYLAQAIDSLSSISDSRPCGLGDFEKPLGLLLRAAERSHCGKLPTNLLQRLVLDTGDGLAAPCTFKSSSVFNPRWFDNDDGID
jgi:hypothetical protein